MHRIQNTLFTLIVLAGLVLAGCDTTTPIAPDGVVSSARAQGAEPTGSSATNRAGAVFTMTNAPEGNEVVLFNRAANGRLAGHKRFATGGAGGDGVTPASNPLALDEAHQYLFVVNAGSDELSVFERWGRSLRRTDLVPSNGPLPLSVTVKENLVYVLNAGRSGVPGTISGFVNDGGTLTSIGTMALPPGTNGPTQIDFNPDGDQLVVTDRPSDTIIVYPVDASGQVGMPVINASDAGSVPFGFDFTPVQGTLLVSEAGGAPGGSALSHYQIADDGTLTTVVNSAPTSQVAACWVEVTPDGAFAYVTNTGSGTVTGFRIQADGSLERLAAITADLGDGSTPLDMTLAGSFLYVQAAGNRAIEGFAIAADGGLTKIRGAATGLPSSVVGLASF